MQTSGVAPVSHLGPEALFRECSAPLVYEIGHIAGRSARQGGRQRRHDRHVDCPPRPILVPALVCSEPQPSLFFMLATNFRRISKSRADVQEYFQSKRTLVPTG